MDSIKQKKVGKTLPFLVNYKQCFKNEKPQFWYDEEACLNMCIHQGEKKPFVHVPDSLAYIKTKSAPGGED